ncbi:beta-galactosidase [Nibricoccus sp. IMCC34717]|uniref:beta-galactosidase n=1 Tax=Nibricoccus sp. IMCC34717 TaxID=3034021 RepID=UPI00384E5336
MNHLRSIRLALASFSLVGGVLADGIPGDSILVGTVYNVFHEEYPTDAEFAEQVNRDIPAMVAANIDHVLIFPMSQWDPATRKLRWERTDHLVRTIEKAGLKFVPLMLKEEQASHYFPIWKYDEIPTIGARHRSRSGGANTRENVDFADPAVFPLVTEHFAEIVARYGQSPALSFYNIWNEPHYWSNADHVVEKFRVWLQRRYGTLESLRQAWGEDYSDWSQVSPFLNDDWNSSLPRMDWTEFRSALPGQLLEQLTSTLRKLDPTHPVNANPVGTAFGTYSELGGYTTDNWRLTEHNDFNGISYYPDGWDRAHAPARQPLWMHNLCFNAARCAAGEKGFVLTELYTNAKNGLTLGGYLDRASMRQVAWLALANDAKGWIFWKWEPFRRGRQSLGRGLVTLEGKLTERGEAVKELGKVVASHGPLLRAAHPVKPKVAMLLDLGGMLKATEQDIEPRTKRFWHDSQAGLFRALDEENIGVDVVRADLGISVEQLAAYRVVFLPFQIVLRPEHAAILRTYVERGGWVVADARTATVDARDLAYRTSPGAGLAELFGAAREDWVAREAPGLAPVELSPQSGSTGRFDGRYFREKLRVATDCEVLATFADDGTPAIISRRVGAGRAILAAVPLGGSYALDGAAPLRAFLKQLCRAAGVDATTEFTGSRAGDVMVREHRRGADRVIYLINGTDTLVKGQLTIRDATGNEVATDLLTGQGVAVTTAAGTATAGLELEPLGVKCLWVR